MQWLEIKVTYEARNIDLASELIADLFYSMGAKGVVIDDPHLDPEQDWGADALPAPEKPAVTGYLPVDDRIGRQCADLSVKLTELTHRRLLQFTVDYRPIDEEDWSQSWKTFFHPQKISASFVVKPSWEAYQAVAGEKVIEIDPGMAFGTGTHPTTALCVQLLEKYFKDGQTLLDVGTGSGILMIAAAKLGAAQLCGVDLDPIAVDIARKNLLLNQVSGEHVALLTGHLADQVNQSFDVVVANILADVIIDLLDRIRRVLKPGGVFICSGIIEASREKVLNRMADLGIELIEACSQGEWVALAGRRKLGV